MSNVLPEGYRKLIFGIICLVGALIFQYLTMNSPEMWNTASGLISPKTLFYVGILIGVGGNFADKLPFLKPKGE